MKISVFKSISKYCRLYGAIVIFSLKSMMEYRVNFFVQLTYGPAYAVILLIMVLTAFARNPQFGGLNQDQGLLLFSVYSLLYTLCLLLFMKGMRHLLWQGIRLGEMDKVLTKPVAPQFLSLFAYPELQHIALLAMSLVLFIRQVIRLQGDLSFAGWVLFCVTFVMGMIILYLSLSTYITATFFVTRAQQIIEVFDKVSDSAQYPTNIFPQSLGAFFFTVIPIAFFGYIPTLFLINQGRWYYLVGGLGILTFFYLTNRLSWRIGLQKYSSASS